MLLFIYLFVKFYHACCYLLGEYYFICKFLEKEFSESPYSMFYMDLFRTKSIAHVFILSLIFMDDLFV